MPSSTTENIAYRQRQPLNPRRKRRIARAVAAAVPHGLLADHQHRHHHRGDRPRAAAPQGPARDHQQPQRRGDPVRQPRLRGDRRRRHRPLARPRHRRRGDGRLHPPVQGRHRPDRHLGHRGRRHPARLRLPRGEGGAGDHRALARGLARRRPQQVQPAGDGRAGAPRRDRPAVHRRGAAARRFPSCSPRPACSCVTCEDRHDRQDAPARPRPGHLELAQHRLRRATAASSPWRSASSGRSSRSPGWVEHDPREIWESQLATAREALAKAGLGAGDIAAIGITNQRETTLRLEPRAPASRSPTPSSGRTGAPRRLCEALKAARPRAARSASSTGLVLDAYFSGTKLAWLLDHVPGARAAAERGELAFGTVDSWLIWKLTGGARRRRAPPSTPPTSATPRARCCSTSTPAAGATSCWQALRRPARAAARGAAVEPCLRPHRRRPARRADPDRRRRRRPAERAVRPGLLRARAGEEHLRHRLLHADEHRHAPPRPRATACITTSAAQGPGPAQYAHRRQRLHRRRGRAVAARRPAARSRASGEVGKLAAERARQRRRDVRAGLHRPRRAVLEARRARHHRRPDAAARPWRHIARAALESIAFQSAALLEAMGKDAVAAGAAPVAELRVDGGASANDLLMQFQADLLGIPVRAAEGASRPRRSAPPTSPA